MPSPEQRAEHGPDNAPRGRRDLTLRGRIVTADRIIADGIIEVTGPRISVIREATEDDAEITPMGLIVPGFVDIHCHGGGGASFAGRAGESSTIEDIQAAAEHHHHRGTTSVVAGLVTDDTDRLLASVAVAADAADDGTIAGILLEGPFLSTARCGAQDPRYVIAPDTGLTRELLAAARGHIVAMSVAPELPGALAVADVLMEYGAIPALGHTDCDVQTATDFLGHVARRGVTPIVTHLFNGMPPVHHRDPGPVAASLTAAARGQAVVELIVDGVHLADATAEMVLTLVPDGAVALISDATAAAGMPDGTYRLGPQVIDVASGVARIATADGPGAIAGSGIDVAAAVRRSVVNVGIDLHRAVRAATATPARLLSPRTVIGDIAVGGFADLVCLDDQLRLTHVLRRGRWLR